ncbi:MULTISPECIES: MarR family winged helix-turn-helix transcriptional regulator [unclassified Nocardioides]|uniref:MarR family winged helix-turn-helix transcriptional regulator n=1 Tax=unclassified Nocardioides TaxID=2615069 RepID=UPI003615F44C
MSSDEHWLGADEQRAWRAWLDAHAHLSSRLNRELQASAGLSLSDYDVLVHLTDVPKARLRAFELGEGLQWEKSRVSRQVARMAARGLVAKEASPEDGRGAYVVLTPAGRRAIEEAAPAHVDLVRRLVFDGLSANQVRTLAKVALSVLRRLDED